MDDSDTSSLSSVAPDEEVQKLAPIFLKAKRATKKVAPPPVASPPRPKREPSPPHEDAFADNPDVAFIVMFRSRFSDAFPPKLAHFGPQDIERAVSEPVPTPQAEALLCALLGLVLNRKKPVEQGHHGRALEEAISSHKSQWPNKWQGRNPLSGSSEFTSMSAEERLYLLRTLIMWSLTSSEDISTLIKDSYKQNRHNDDENQPLSVQPWGRDGDKRRYFLIEGQDDTSFRVYREGHRLDKKVQWYSMAGDIEEVKALASRLETTDGTQAARTMSARMLAAVPRFEATEEKRRRREYRQIRKAQFTRPEPGFSLYEGRTRGKRMRYTFEDEDALSDDFSSRRSGRLSDRDTPLDAGPVTTLSGRRVKPRRDGAYSTGLLNGTDDRALDEDLGSASDDSRPRPSARATRNARPAYQISGKQRASREDDLDDGFSDDDDQSIGEWDSEANGNDEYDMPDADDEDDDDAEIMASSGDDLEPKSLIVRLKISPTTERFKAAYLDDVPPANQKESSKVDEASSQPFNLHVTQSSTSSARPDATSTQVPQPLAQNDRRYDQYDSPLQQHLPTAQTSLSGYPTPASLPPPAFKAEGQLKQEQEHSVSSAQLPSVSGLHSFTSSAHPPPQHPPTQPAPYVVAADHAV